MATSDEVAVAFARSILTEEGIHFRAKGEGLRRFGGTTFLGASLGPAMGPTLIQVYERDFADARELLQGLSGVER